MLPDKRKEGGTLEQLIQDQGLKPQSLAECFIHGQIFGIGHTVRRFLVNYKEKILP
ncbi:MAG: hypothetical protein NTX88_01650 [Candidatus Atribacteria bacterium]|nr:hypothetical protein [Candidatus Atribacteria bacterium]